jgi:hypothetical protein
MSDFQHRIVKANGIRIHAVEEGEGPRLSGQGVARAPMSFAFGSRRRWIFW